ncbi:MAG: AMP-binding protein [Paracoccaceae bacterium]
MADHLLDAFAQSVARYGDRIALIEGDGTRVSFRQLQSRARAFAAKWSAAGLGPGDRLLVAMPIGADLYAALAAIWSLGAVAVLPEPAMGLKGVRHAVAIGGIKGLCAAGGYRWLRLLLPALWGKPLFSPGSGHVEPSEIGRQTKAEDLALISFTSGSTGAPKAIPRSHAFLMAQRRAVSPLLKSPLDEVDLVAFPVFVLINLAEGRTSVLPNWRMSRLDELSSAQLQGWITAQQVTRLLLPPALCETLAQTNIPESVTTLFTGGGPVFPDLVAKLKSRAPALRIVSVYGSTEAEPIAEFEASDTDPDDLEAMKTGSGLLAGAPVSPVQVRIEDSEILVSGPHVNDGYLDPARDAETKVSMDGKIWHRTGDAGYLDPRGRLWLLGRAGGAVQTCMGDVHPFVIETAARQWPGVRRVALVRIGDQGALAIEGDAGMKAAWATAAAAFGIEDVRVIAKMLMDRRHRSKVDMAALKTLLER